MTIQIILIFSSLISLIGMFDTPNIYYFLMFVFNVLCIFIMCKYKIVNYLKLIGVLK